MALTLITTISDMRQWSRRNRASGRLALVPTMGALHTGHLSLIETAARHADQVIVSIFVNPAQFGPNEDFERYPRTLDTDVALLESLPVDAVFAPSTAEMYPTEPHVTITIPNLAKRLCGASRPGHFDGVGLVVSKLFHIVDPDIAVFGEKDWQQLQIIRQMVADLNMHIDIIGSPIIREPDGLAMSSRNRYLTDRERKDAAMIFQGLTIGRDAVRNGLHNSADLIKLIHQHLPLDRHRLEYLEVVDPQSLTPIDEITNDCLIAIAMHLGNTRLIDNMYISKTEFSE